jgi:3-methyl-2-oxobutanoate hydroxymethyltransferase
MSAQTSIKRLLPPKLVKRLEPWVAITAYDYLSAKLCQDAGVEIILVGDSLGMVVLGYDSTIPVTMDEMLHHTKAVVRGNSSALIIGDMPFGSYHTSVPETVANALRFFKEGGVQAVKLEGASEFVLSCIRQLVNLGMPVVGHIGFTPQSLNQMGVAVQGKTPAAIDKLKTEALALQEAGVSAVVLELVPREVAGEITELLSIPTIGIGAGGDNGGQIQVWHDLLGYDAHFTPKHAKKFGNSYTNHLAALQDYIVSVKNGSFPSIEHSSQLKRP